MAPSLRRMMRRNTINTAQNEETNASPSLQRSNSDDLLSQAQVTRLKTRYDPLFDYSRRRPTETGERYLLDCHGRKIPLLTPEELAEHRGKLPLSKFAIPQPPPPTASSIGQRDFILDTYDREIAGPLNPQVTSLPKVERAQARGHDFNMVVTDTDSGASMPLTSNLLEMEDTSRRRTRSSNRRQERADSHQEDADKVSTRDFATKPRSDSLQVPALSIRKHNNDKPTRIPSPRSSPRSPSEDMPLPPQTAENLRKIPIDTLLDSEYTCLPKKLPDVPPKQSMVSKAAMTLGFSSASNQRQLPPPPPPAGNPRNDCRLPPISAPILPKPIPVIVRPPVYDPTKPAGLQWSSSGITNSRPHQPWEPSPRWMCCKCGAETIVEQTVCAKLTCMHDRCPVRCQVTVRHHKGGLPG